LFLCTRRFFFVVPFVGAFFVKFSLQDAGGI
jgi:hypothetical protein